MDEKFTPEGAMQFWCSFENTIHRARIASSAKLRQEFLIHPSQSRQRMPQLSPSY
ncbi:unnamed protein product [Larinioides sclopetarius]|uniref:Uncharacterized protein n=1 Tax=Larinioides sclopetarius TaxID=280406 RepID=A0AAV2B8R7_9ARAC